MLSLPGKGRNMQLSRGICPFLHNFHDCAHMAGNGHRSLSPPDSHPIVISQRLKVWAG